MANRVGAMVVNCWVVIRKFWGWVVVMLLMVHQWVVVVLLMVD